MRRPSTAATCRSCRIVPAYYFRKEALSALGPHGNATRGLRLLKVICPPVAKAAKPVAVETPSAVAELPEETPSTEAAPEAAAEVAAIEAVTPADPEANRLPIRCQSRAA